MDSVKSDFLKRYLGRSGDRCSLGYNPFRKVWIYSLRHGWSGPRARRYAESKVFGEGAWGDVYPPYWTSADRLDGMRPELKTPPQLYNLDCAGYESLMIGLFTIYRRDPFNERDLPKSFTAAEVAKLREPGRPKLNEISIGYSRDGFHWHRPNRRPFLPVSEEPGSWNWGNVQSVGGCCVVVGDRLYFYMSGRAGKLYPGSPSQDSGGSTGVAFLRRDGFATLDADDGGGIMTTRTVQFSGKHLFVNLAAPAGELRVEILDEFGNPIAPFTKSNCEPLAIDSTLAEVRWKGGGDLGKYANRSVKFRFHLTSGSFYAFWVSPDSSGASFGYLGGGGPGYLSQQDTVGRAALKAVLPN